MKSALFVPSTLLLWVGLHVMILSFSWTASVVVAVHANSVDPAVDSYHFHHQQPTSRQPYTSSNQAATVLQVPRGGAWYFGKKTAARKYRELLEEQVKTLDKQLRQSQDELALLRRQLKTSQSLLHRNRVPSKSSSDVQTAKLQALAENHDLKNRIQSLTREVDALSKMRDDLQTIIDNQHKKMVELEERMKQQATESSALTARHEKAMEQLKRDIESKYQKQLADLTALMNKRVQEAQESARQQALKEVSFKVQQATAAERARGEKLLDDERKKSEAAVEREKVKMRKLAKALFEREKKLNTLDKDLTDSSTIKASASPMASGKTSGTYKVDTIRKY